ncbi:MAG: cyclic pyranopterin monophosphate synthase MoaC [Planctomycetota bacterium]
MGEGDANPSGTTPAQDPERQPGSEGLSHIETGQDGSTHARMVDVGAKAVTQRSAVARAVVEFPEGLLGGLLAGEGPKGPIEEVARVAGVLAAKRTGDLVPMCHPLGLDVVEIAFEDLGGDVLEVRCRTACQGRTGVEMEAMTGAAVAALTVYDMTKAASKGIRIGAVELLEKTGGNGGTWRRSEDDRSA